MLIEQREGESVTEESMRHFLAERVAKWWLPDAIIFAAVPLTATGKIDKKVIRDRYRNFLNTET